jgi:hypothetical protein
MKALIVQPMYLPWCGYLAMLDACDVFVIYDDVQFDHQSWQHRNKIRNQNGWMWLTVPILRKEGQLINEVMIDNSKHWRQKHWHSIYQNYSTVAYFKQYKNAFEMIYQAKWEKLIDLNLALLHELAVQLNIRIPKILKSSEMETSGSKTDRLVPILKAVGADVFIEGLAGKSYLEVQKFRDAGIETFWFDYQHPVYPQQGEFIPYLSTIDLLMNTGDKAIDYLRKGVNLVQAE